MFYNNEINLVYAVQTMKLEETRYVDPILTMKLKETRSVDPILKGQNSNSQTRMFSFRITIIISY